MQIKQKNTIQNAKFTFILRTNHQDTTIALNKNADFHNDWKRGSMPRHARNKDINNNAWTTMNQSLLSKLNSSVSNFDSNEQSCESLIKFKPSAKQQESKYGCQLLRSIFERKVAKCNDE